MELFCLIEECDDYNPDNKLQKEYHDCDILGLLNEIDRLNKKVKRLQSKIRIFKLQLESFHFHSE